MKFLHTYQIPTGLFALAISAVLLASWLSRTDDRPESVSAPTIVPAESVDALAPTVAESPPEVISEPPSIPPVTDTPPPALPAEDWLHPNYGLSAADDLAAIAALTALADGLDFRTFWLAIMPLAERGNDFALYLSLAFRDFMPLSDATLRFGFVEEPYLEQRRRDYSSPNWLHWLFARWRPDWQPTAEQRTEALSRALAGNAAAQTLLVSQSEWFTDQPGFADRLNELLARLPDNHWLHLYNLTNLSARSLATAGPEDPALNNLLRQLRTAGHPLTHWLAQVLEPARSSAEQRRAGLLRLAHDGYVTALQEVRLLATTGSGRWTNATDTPMTLRDAIDVHQQQAARHPRNPLISVALCELNWHTGDYQASWEYLQKFAYQDTWADEVEDYTCTRAAPRAYGNTLIELGVITEPQWQQHIATIDARRARIQSQEQ